MATPSPYNNHLLDMLSTDLATGQVSQAREKALTWSKGEGDRFIPRRTSMRINDFHIHRVNSTYDLECDLSRDTSMSDLLKFSLNKISTRSSRKQFFKYRPENEKKNILDTLDDQSQAKSKSVQRSKFVLPKKPFKVLEAPNISDDFYHSIFQWSSSNLLGVNLDNNIYTLDADSGEVTKIYEAFDCEAVTSLQWNEAGDQLAMGNILGQISIWDVNTQKEITNFDSHEGRVCAMDWRSTLISGSKDSKIVQHDFRAKSAQVKTYQAHSEEVCKLRWSPDEQLFCSGGNDNKFFIWSPQSQIPIMKGSHNSCVKAMAWSENQHGMLATGGGSADKMIKTWNAMTKELVHERLTGSQVCSLIYSKHTNDLISAHGFPNNEINIWRANGLKKVGSLLGHTERVLYLNLSPCASTLVSCAGDETLRFWKLYDGYQTDSTSKQNEVLVSSKIR